MDVSKTMLAVCAGILLVCLFFCVTALTSLRNTVDENEAWRAEAEVLVDDLNACIERLEKNEAPTEEKDDSLEVDAKQEGYCMREANGKIAVYTEDGLLIKVFEINVSTLPHRDREALYVGIPMQTWQEVSDRVQDYGG